jgi:hypothetical protein
MNADQDRLMEIFGEARSKSSPADRAAYLTEACGSDSVLRQQVEALLIAYEHAGDFPSQPTVKLAEENPTEGPGTVIGRYKLLQLIGEGGFGAVYMAEQKEPVKRRVALKVIKLGMDTKQVVARFEAERQALALMDHPNIARVFDAGTTGAPLGSAGCQPAVSPTASRRGSARRPAGWRWTSSTI